MKQLLPANLSQLHTLPVLSKIGTRIREGELSRFNLFFLVLAFFGSSLVDRLTFAQLLHQFVLYQPGLPSLGLGITMLLIPTLPALIAVQVITGNRSKTTKLNRTAVFVVISYLSKALILSAYTLSLSYYGFNRSQTELAICLLAFLTGLSYFAQFFLLRQNFELSKYTMPLLAIAILGADKILVSSYSTYTLFKWLPFTYVSMACLIYLAICKSSISIEVTQVNSGNSNDFKKTSLIQNNHREEHNEKISLLLTLLQLLSTPKSAVNTIFVLTILLTNLNSPMSNLSLHGLALGIIVGTVIRTLANSIQNGIVAHWQSLVYHRLSISKKIFALVPAIISGFAFFHKGIHIAPFFFLIGSFVYCFDYFIWQGHSTQLKLSDQLTPYLYLLLLFSSGVFLEQRLDLFSNVSIIHAILALLSTLLGLALLGQMLLNSNVLVKAVDGR